MARRKQRLPFRARGFSRRLNIEALEARMLLTSAALLGHEQVIKSEYNGVDAVEAADLDDDGDADLVSSSYLGGIWWSENLGDGEFANHQLAWSETGVRSLKLADVDGDGDVDVVSGGEESSTFAWHENDGLGSFQTHAIASVVLPALEIDVADIDGDGDVDILAGHDTSIAWYENDGAESFAAHTIATTDFQTRAIQLIDFDGDGDRDFVATEHYTAAISWYENDGAEAFVRRVIGPGSAKAIEFVAADVDGDGDVDVVGGRDQNSRFGWLRNDGGGLFRYLPIMTSSITVYSVSVADMDGDLDLDVVLGRGTGSFNSIAVFTRSGSAFTERSGGGVMTTGNDHAVGDLDGDGDLDIAAAFSDRNSGTVDEDRSSWLENTSQLVSIQYLTVGTASEQNSQFFSMNFHRTGETLNPLVIHFDVLGTAPLFGVDYTQTGASTFSATSGTITIPANEEFATLVLQVVDDGLFELDETLRIAARETSAYALDETGMFPVYLNITDNDAGDYGDAPAPYPTTEAQNGPRHGATGPRLGATRDAELSGQPSPLADGDDEAADPAGGVTFGPIQVGQQNSTVTVDVQNAPAGARLDAWIDFDGDGNWGGAGEQIFNSVAVVGGANVLRFDVPSGARSGESYARFRLSTAGGLGIVGESIDGEVEDTLMTILPPTATPGEFAARPLELAGWLFVRDIQLGDLDDDGDLDLVSPGSGIYWHEMEGGEIVAQHLIAPSDPMGSGIFEIKLCDLDSDGDLDVVASGATTLLQDGWAALFWLENDGTGSFLAHAIGSPFSGLSRISPVDFDSDGDVDLLGLGDGITLYANDGTQQFAARNLRHFFGGVASTPILPTDFDSDGDLDIVLATSNYDGRRILLLVNDGYGNLSERKIGNYETSIEQLAVADLDGDGDLDVVWGSYGLDWAENRGSSPFVYHTLWDAKFAGLEALAIADVNGDGQDDVVTSDNSSGGGWWEHLGGGEFAYRVSTKYALSLVKVGDMDGDGDLDLAGMNAADPYSIQPARLSWLENVSTSVSVTSSQSTLSENGAESIIYTFYRDGQTDRELTVSIRVAGSAEYGIDYQQTGAAQFAGDHGSVVFPVGVDTVQVVISLLDDNIIESNESVIIALAPGADYVPTGAEVATSQIVDNEPGDFGDAPFPYPTTLDQNGARHGTTGPRLGNRRDGEANGSPSDDADGDDLSNIDDDDGVLFGEIRVGQTDATLYAYVTNAPAGARLDAWIDFDGDGSWGGVAEHVAVSVVVAAGMNEIRFAVPAAARSGETYARVRLSSAGELGSTGAASDGEVEDYRAWIEPPLGPGGPFAPREVSTLSANINYIVSGDLDNDGDIDLLTQNYSTTTPYAFAWHENVGNGVFVRRTIDTSYEHGQVPDMGLIVTDMNGDGWNDLVARGSSALVIYLNDQQGGFNAQPAVPDTRADSYRYHSVSVIDAEGDGDQDVILQSFDGAQDEVVLLTNRGDGTFARSRIMVGEFDVTQAIDIDRDGDFDLVGRLGYSPHPAICVNDGHGNFVLQPMVTYSHYESFWSVKAIDLDGDDDIDLLTVGSTLRWFENRGDEGFVERFIASTSSSSVSGVSVADIDGDGRLDIIASQVQGRSVAWYKNNGDGQFTQRMIDANATDFYAAIPIDIDQDGDLDVISRSSWQIAVYENLSILSGDYDQNGRVEAADYTVWRDALGATGLAPYGGADGDGDGTVDADDYAVWKANFGRVMESGGSGGGSAIAVATWSEALQADGESSVAGRVSSGTPIAPQVLVRHRESADAIRVRGSRLQAGEVRRAQGLADRALVAWVVQRALDLGDGRDEVELAVHGERRAEIEPKHRDDVFARLGACGAIDR